MAVPTGLMPDQLELFLEGPALSPPPNVKSNFDNPYTFGSAVFIDEIIFLILPTLAIMMLVYTKLRIVRKREPEDCEEHNFSSCFYRYRPNGYILTSLRLCYFSLGMYLFRHCIV